MQVIHELRNGVKLRKVNYEINQHHRHIEYELTPFEILLDQIRSKRYHLRKVVVSELIISLFIFFLNVFEIFILLLSLIIQLHQRLKKTQEILY